MFCLVPELFDWVSYDTAELLTGYQPSGELMAIFENNIDLDSQ